MMIISFNSAIFDGFVSLRRGVFGGFVSLRGFDVVCSVVVDYLLRFSLC